MSGHARHGCPWVIHTHIQECETWIDGSSSAATAALGREGAQPRTWAWKLGHLWSWDSPTTRKLRMLQRK